MDKLRHLLAILICATLTLRCASSRDVTTTGDLGQRVDALLTRYEAYGFSGTVLVEKDGRIVLHKGYGLADRERGVRNGTGTLFEVASLTKTFTAAAILELERKGKLRTSDPLSQHLGRFPPEKAAATIHHLATHTAGLVPAGTELPAGHDRERFIESVKRVPRESPPGERYRYSNAGYHLLAAVTEVASGAPFEENVQVLIDRAGLKETYFRGAVPAAVLPRVARGYVGTPANIEVSTPPPYEWDVRGSGGMIMTVADLHRWYRALRAGRILGPEQTAKMFRPSAEEAYGWHVERDSAGRALTHKGGGMPEYASQLLDYTDDRLVIIWASNNLRQRWRQALNRGIAAVAFGNETVPLPPPQRNATLSRFAGTYITDGGKAFELVASGEGHLYAGANDAGVPDKLLYFVTGPDELTGFEPTTLAVTRLAFDGDTVRVILPRGEVTARKRR